MKRYFYRARLVKDGPFVGVMVWHGGPLVDGEQVDRSPRWQALVGTETTARAVLMGNELPVDVDGATLRNLEPIKEHEYRFMVADAAHASDWRPDDPKASPRKAIDFHTLKPRF
jgi:hypothetical protein